jgi:Holliday junction DNA helicase RuvA
MIGYLTGNIKHIDDKSVIVMTASGVGYEILSPLNVLISLKAGESLNMWIHTHVREDQIALFGFLEHADRELFRKLTSVSGVGPKSGLAALSVASNSTLIRAIESGKADNFPKVPGLGKKTIEKIIIELRGKFDVHELVNSETESVRDAKMALETLGYNARDISETLNTLHPDLDMGSLIREALKILSKTK